MESDRHAVSRVAASSLPARSEASTTAFADAPFGDHPDDPSSSHRHGYARCDP
jgi:hypothetical protein